MQNVKRKIESGHSPAKEEKQFLFMEILYSSKIHHTGFTEKFNYF